MAYLIGITLAVATALLGRIAGFDREKAYYATILIVVAHYYVLFAAIGDSPGALVTETIAMMVFVAAAVAGFRLNQWIVVAALAGHGAFDFVHGHLVNNPGVPVFWPAFCAAYDVGLAALAGFILFRRQSAPAQSPSHAR